MADINSDLMALIRSTPREKLNIRKSGGRNRSKVAKIEHTGSQSNSDVMRFFRVRSSDLVKSLQLSCDATSGMTDVNYGLHDIDGGGAVDDNLFDDAQTMASALTQQEKRVGSNSALGIETLTQTVWELLGLSADPQKEYDVTGTIITAGSATATVVLEMEYNAGD